MTHTKSKVRSTVLAGVLAAASLLTGCAGLTTQTDADANRLEGVAYYMPMKYFTLTVTKVAGVITKLELGETAAFADMRKTYALQYNPHWLGKTTIGVEVGTNGLLGKANTNTTDSNAELAKLTYRPFLADAKRLRPGSECAPDGVFVFTYETPEDVKPNEKVCEFVSVQLERTWDINSTKTGQQANPPNSASEKSAPGIFYRVNRAYLATASTGATKSAKDGGQYVTKLLFVPNESPNMFLPYGRTLFAANDGKIGLSEGILQSYSQANDGELVALLKFPASILSAYFNAVGNVFSAFTARDNNEIAALKAELKNASLRQKLEKCLEARGKDDDAAWKALGCDALIQSP